jgi:DNA mismatch endonuclease Vsr
MDKLTKEQRRKNMQAVKSKGSKIENAFSKALWGKGYRFGKNVKSIIGKPDIVFRKYKVAIFIDSEFWHGKDWSKRKKEHKSNIKFWHNKIEGNIKRDKVVNKELKKLGWIVLRFWGKQIENNLDKCILKTEKVINEIRSKLIN